MGKWKAFQGPNGGWAVEIPLSPGRYALAYCGREEYARLIAAAPEMYEALIRAVHELRIAQSIHEQDGSAVLAGTTAVAVQNAEEVLAKAQPPESDDG